MKKKLFFLSGLLLILSGCAQKSHSDLLKWVDPFIGTGGHGHTFPGATRPYSLIQVSPDTHLSGWEASSGYHDSDSLIYGFSNMHLSGTGIGDLGDVAILPYTGTPDSIPVGNFSKKNEKASPGYYSVYLDNFDIKVELTSTERVALHKYTFPEKERRVMLNLAHILQPNWGHSIIANTITIVSPEKIQGTITTKGWAHNHIAHYTLEFSEPFAKAELITNNVDEYINSYPYTNDTLKNAQLYFEFSKNSNPLLAKVSISGVDQKGASDNILAEMDHWDFLKTKTQSEEIWQNALSKVRIRTSDTIILRNFYTALYHTMMAPILWQDSDGRYKGMDKEIHTAKEGHTNYTAYSLWDTFRAIHPWLTVFDTDKAIAMGRGLIKGYEEGGILPKWPLVSNYTGCMVGYPAVSILADLATKGYISQSELNNWLTASKASSVYRPDLAEKFKETREADLITKHLYYKEQFGYIPADSIEGSVSWGVEMAYYDWCISQIAKITGDTSAYNEYRTKGNDYKRYFDNKTGFMRGILSDGSFRTPFNPHYSAHMESDYVEGTAYQWSYFFPHDIDGFTELIGGRDSLENYLDKLFNASTHVDGTTASSDITGLIGQYAHGNEPSHHIAYMYNWTNHPEKGQEKLDYILRNFYSPTPDGIIGNEDCGQMSAWYIMSTLGFYQVCPGEPVYSIGRPLIDQATIRMKEGILQIDVENNSPENKYIKEVYINEKPVTNLSFTHNDIKNGGRIKIIMTNKTN
ncbi:MAG: GH92 family glycosyl hydrolase [Bacteroidales bacterium]